MCWLSREAQSSITVFASGLYRLSVALVMLEEITIFKFNLIFCGVFL